MRRLLTSAFGCEVIEATDGMSAIDALSTHDHFDLAVIDIGMPVMSGLEVLDVIRESDVHATLPVVFFSGTHDESTARTAISAGANDFMVKPFRLSVVKPRLEQALRAPRKMQEKASASVAQGGPVVVIDGSPDFLHFCSSALAGAHTVLTTHSGVGAIELCRTERPFAVLIGGETGLLKADLLARKIRESGCPESVLIAVLDEPTPGIPRDFDAALTRTFVPEAFTKAFRQCYERRFSLVADLPAFALVRKTAISSAQQALGMLAHTDVAVTTLEQAERRAGDVLAAVTLSMWKGTVAVDMELRCSLDAAKITAANLLGIDAATTSEEDACSAVGELANIVAGRIQGIVAADYGPSTFTIPKLSLDQTPSDASVQLALRATATDASVSFDLLMSARPVRVRARAA